MSSYFPPASHRLLPADRQATRIEKKNAVCVGFTADPFAKMSMATGADSGILHDVEIVRAVFAKHRIDILNPAIDSAGERYERHCL